MSRELTRQEKAAIRKLVTKWCANYDKDYGCLPLDCPCYMLGKCWTGAYCRYFRSAVLPLDPVLERSLTVERITETRPCPVCGRAFLPDGRQRYCSPACAGTACGSRSGRICAASGGSAWKNSPGKCLHLQGFSGRFWGGRYVFPPTSVFAETLSTSKHRGFGTFCPEVPAERRNYA